LGEGLRSTASHRLFDAKGAISATLLRSPSWSIDFTFAREPPGNYVGFWIYVGPGLSAATWCYASFSCERPSAWRSAVGPLERAHVVLPLWCCQGRLQFRRQLQRQSAIRNDPVDAALVPHSTHVGIFQYSSLFLSPATDCTLRLRSQLICRDNEYRIRHRIRHID